MEARITRAVLRDGRWTGCPFGGPAAGVDGRQSAHAPTSSSRPTIRTSPNRSPRRPKQYRHDLAVAWLGQAMPNWSQPCVMTVQAAPHLGAGGATTFVFEDGEVFGWRMSIQGSRERILDSVLPHEITHMIFASHFRQPLPRWADEGGATSVEHAIERNKHRQMLPTFLRTRPRHRLQPDVRHDGVSARLSCRSTPRAIRWPSSSSRPAGGGSTSSFSTTG